MADAASLPIPGAFARLAEAVPQPLRDMLAQPAVQRARPAILAVLALGVVALLGLALRQPDWRPLYADLSDADKAAVTAALAAGNYDYRINPDTGSIEVPDGDAAAARILLAGQGLPKAARPLDPVGDMPLGLSRPVEAARLKAALAQDLAASVEAIEGVKSARVHVALPEPSVFIRESAQPSASVFVTMAAGRTLSEAQVRAIVWLVATSVPGLAGDRVSVVDQSGALLSAGVSGDAQQLAYQARLETMVRERLVKLLTPLIGTGRFTAEVAADVDFSQNEAASERYQPAGTLKSEQASRNLDTTPPPAKGIPGALTNTAPQAAQITATPPATAPAPAPAPTVTAEETNRLWEIGKDVSVTRGLAPRLKRLSVAVVIDRAANPKATPQDIAALTRIVRGAVGYDAARGDLVEVQLRGFAPPPAEPLPPLLERPEVRQWLPLGLLGAAVLAGGGLWWWRQRGRAAQVPALAVDGNVPGQTGEASAPAPIDGGDLTPTTPAIDYGGKLDRTRDLVTTDTDRALAAARQMLLGPPETAPEPAE